MSKPKAKGPYLTPGKKDVENCPRHILSPLSPDAASWKRRKWERLRKVLRLLARAGVDAAIRREKKRGREE